MLTIFRPDRLESPLKTGRAEFLWSHVVVVVGMHLLALLACVPWLFSWTGGDAVFRWPVRIRYVGHQHWILTAYSHIAGLRTPKWFDTFTGDFGRLLFARYAPVAGFRTTALHHQFSDEDDDPHSPLVRFPVGGILNGC